MKKFLFYSVTCFVGLFLLLFFTVLLILFSLPNTEKISGCLKTKMNDLYLCPSDDSYVHYNSVPKHVIDSIIIAEDARFFSHNGFDWDELKNSLLLNLEEKRYVRGASTITQQLVKNVFLTNEKTLWRKIKEALITLKVEKLLSKNEILEKYLTIVQFGNGIFGLKKASQFYFDKSPNELSLFESAYLAHLLPNPEVYSQMLTEKGHITDFSSTRILSLCKNLYKYKRISELEFEFCKLEIKTYSTSPDDAPLIDDTPPIDDDDKPPESYST